MEAYVKSVSVRSGKQPAHLYSAKCAPGWRSAIQHALAGPLPHGHRLSLPLELQTGSTLKHQFWKGAGIQPDSPVVSDEALPQPQLPENVHHYLHWGVVSHCEGAHVQNAPELQWPRAFCWERWRVLCKTHT